MENCIEDIYYKFRAWLNPKWATYANAHNTWSFGLQPPETMDYIFHRSQNPLRVIAWTDWFQMPIFKTPFQDMNISLSDHEAVTSSLSIKKILKPMTY